jgi:hypothetical protein
VRLVGDAQPLELRVLHVRDAVLVAPLRGIALGSWIAPPDTDAPSSARAAHRPDGHHRRHAIFPFVRSSKARSSKARSTSLHTDHCADEASVSPPPHGAAVDEEVRHAKPPQRRRSSAEGVKPGASHLARPAPALFARRGR